MSSSQKIVVSIFLVLLVFSSLSFASAFSFSDVGGWFSGLFSGGKNTGQVVGSGSGSTVSTGSIKFYVVDYSSDSTISGASVKLYNPSAGAFTATAESILYAFSNIPIGSYTATLSASGYTSVSQTITVNVGTNSGITVFLTKSATTSGSGSGSGSTAIGSGSGSTASTLSASKDISSGLIFNMDGSNPGVNGGKQSNEGIGGKSLELNGVDAYLVGSSFSSPTSELTLAIWAMPETLGSGGNDITGSMMSKRDSFILSPEKDGSVKCYVNVNGQWRAVSTIVNAVSFPNEWTHWACTYNGAELSLYQNGNVVAKTAISGTLGTSGKLCLGQDCGFSGRFFDGLLDEAYVYNRALSPSEVNDLYTQQKNQFSTGTPSTGTTATCIDSDATSYYSDGKNPLLNGTVTSISGTFTDSCYSEKVVKEYLCDNGIGDYNVLFIPCPTGTKCQGNGMCVGVSVGASVEKNQCGEISTAVKAKMLEYAHLSHTAPPVPGQALILTEGQWTNPYASANSGSDYFMLYFSNGPQKEYLVQMSPLSTDVGGLSNLVVRFTDVISKNTYDVPLVTDGSFGARGYDYSKGADGFLAQKNHTGQLAIGGNYVNVFVRYTLSPRYPVVSLTWGDGASFGNVGSVKDTFNCGLTNVTTAVGGAESIGKNNGQYLFKLISSPGEYVGLGGTYLTTNKSDITFRYLPYGDGYRVRFDFAGFDINIYSTTQGKLQEKIYPIVQRFNTAELPALDIYGNGRGCNNLKGYLEIFEIGYEGDKINRFSANFTTVCDNKGFLTGEVRYNSLGSDKAGNGGGGNSVEKLPCLPGYGLVKGECKLITDVLSLDEGSSMPVRVDDKDHVIQLVKVNSVEKATVRIDGKVYSIEKKRVFEVGGFGIQIVDLFYTTKSGTIGNMQFIINPSINGAITPVNKATCDNGCLNGENKCLPYGTRQDGLYCSLSGVMADQETENAVCENNYECNSNFCADGKCLEQGFFDKVLGWFRNLFGGSSKPVLFPKTINGYTLDSASVRVEKEQCQKADSVDGVNLKLEGEYCLKSSSASYESKENSNKIIEINLIDITKGKDIIEAYVAQLYSETFNVGNGEEFFRIEDDNGLVWFTKDKVYDLIFTQESDSSNAADKGDINNPVIKAFKKKFGTDYDTMNRIAKMPKNPSNGGGTTSKSYDHILIDTDNAVSARISFPYAKNKGQQESLYFARDSDGIADSSLKLVNLVNQRNFPISVLEGENLSLNSLVVVNAGNDGRILQLTSIGAGTSSTDKTVFKDVWTGDEFEFTTGVSNGTSNTIGAAIYYVATTATGSNGRSANITWGAGANVGSTGIQKTLFPRVTLPGGSWFTILTETKVHLGESYELPNQGKMSLKDKQGEKSYINLDGSVRVEGVINLLHEDKGICQFSISNGPAILVGEPNGNHHCISLSREGSVTVLPSINTNVLSSDESLQLKPSERINTKTQGSTAFGTFIETDTSDSNFVQFFIPWIK